MREAEEEQTMKLKPLNDWAVIIPAEAEHRTAGGLYIPEAAKEKPAEGVVEAIGPGALEEEDRFGRKKKKEKKERKFIPTTVKPGERVLYEKYAGQKITLGTDERVLVRERDILGIYAGGSSSSGAKTLMLPEKTSGGETSLATLAMKSIMAVTKGQVASSKGKEKAKKKAAKKTVKKKSPGTGSRGPGKTKKKAAKKITAKKAAPKKTVKKAVKKGKKKR